MKTKCPNINSESWKRLVKGVGEKMAWKTVVAYDGLPSDEVINQIITAYDNSSLFGIDTEHQESLEFHINTVQVVTDFLDKIGVKPNLVPELLGEAGTLVEGAVAVNNYLKGTVDILDEVNKRPEAWNQLPRAAVEWWYKLLVKSNKNPNLFTLLYNDKSVIESAIEKDKIISAGDKHIARHHLTKDEEVIDRIVAAMKRIETENAAARDYSFFKKFIEWVNSIIKEFMSTEEDVFEVAAMKILSHDISDLMSFKEYKALEDRLYGSELTQASIDEQKRIEEVRDAKQYINNLINKRFVKRTKFLKKTLDKYVQLVDSNAGTNSYPTWNIRESSLTIKKRLTEYELGQLVAYNNYKNVTPTLRGLPLILKKYKNQRIALNQPMALDGVKKVELKIYNSIIDLIRNEHPELKSITAEELVNEIHNYVQTNFLLGFADEKNYLTYRIDQLFTRVPDRLTNEDINIENLTEEQLRALPINDRQELARMLGLTKQNSSVQHRKISLRYNDEYFHNRSGHFNYAPSAWGNLTYFYSKTGKFKDAVLLHEIQNDNIEYLREYKPGKINLEASLEQYTKSIEELLQKNIQKLQTGGKELYYSRDTMKLHFAKGLLGTQLKTAYDSGMDEEMAYQNFMQGLEEHINLFQTNTRTLEATEAYLEKEYSLRRQWQDLMKRGGLKRALDREDWLNLQGYIEALNAGEVDIDREGNERLLSSSIKEKKRSIRSSNLVRDINTKIKEYLTKNYSPDLAKRFYLSEFPAKSRTKQQRARGMLVKDLNPSVRYILYKNEWMVLDSFDKQIKLAKIAKNTEVVASLKHKYNLKLAKMSLKQYKRIYRAYKDNVVALTDAVEARGQQLLEQNLTGLQVPSYVKTIYRRFLEKLSHLPPQTADIELASSSDVGIEGAAYDPTVHKDKEYYYLTEYLGGNREQYFRVKIVDVPKLVEKTHALETKIESQQLLAKKLIEEASKVKEDIEGSYKEAEASINQILELESNYFNPLVHHLIQTHIREVGKNVPMYFAGYAITKKSQGSDRTALIYAGPEEVKFTPEEARQIKLKVAQNLGIVGANDEEVLKALTVYKRTSRENNDRVIYGIMQISKNQPIETGALYNAMSQLPGIKLIYVDVVEGIGVGGYLVDLTNYDFESPVLYQLASKSNNAKDKLIKRLQNEGLVNRKPFTYKGQKELTIRKVDPKKSFTQEQGQVYQYETNKKALEDINAREFGGNPVIELIPFSGGSIVRINEPLLNTIEANRQAQLESGKRTVDLELKQKLLQFARKYGIREEVIDNMYERYGQDAVAVADLLNNVIAVAKGKEDSDAIIEEVAHFAIELLGDDHPFVKRIMQLVDKSAKYQEVVAQYSEAYKGDVNRLKKETAGKLLAEVIQERWSEYKTQSDLFRVLNKIWAYIKRLFEKVSYNEANDELRQITGQIAEDILTDNLSKFDIENLKKANKPLFQLNEDSPALKQLKKDLEKSIEVINKKLTLYRKRGDKRFARREQTLLNNLVLQYEENKTKEGIINFITAVRNDLGGKDKPSTVLGRLFSFNTDIGEANDVSNTLRTMLAFAKSFLPIVKSVKLTIEGDADMMADADMKKLLDELKVLESDISSANDLVKNHLYTLLGKEWKNWGGEYTYDKKGNKVEIDWIDAFKSAPQDISFAERFFDALADAKDPILQVFDKITKAMKGEAQRKSDVALQKIINEHKALEKAGFTPDKVVVELDGDRVTGNWVTRYNIGKYDRVLTEFDTEIRKKYGLKPRPKPGEPKLTEEELKPTGNALKQWQKEWGMWFDANTDWVDNYQEIMDSKKAEYINDYGKEVGEQVYEDWLKQNRHVSYDRHGNEYVKPRGELQRPANKYLNKQYDEIMKNPAKKVYYDTVYGLHMEQVKKLNEGQQLYMWHTLPQVMKEYLERVKDRGFNISEQSKELKTTVSNYFVRHEGDVEFGSRYQLTDESDKPVQFLPVHYTHLIQNKNNLSLDVSASVAKFYATTENYHQLSKVIHILEAGKDLMKERKYDVRDAFGGVLSDPVGFFKDKSQKIQKDASEAVNALNRLNEYAQANWYGELKKDEGQLFGTGIDQAKLIDMLGRYVSINSLALNLYSGLSNVTYGNAMLLEEAIAGEYFGFKNMWRAIKTYNTEMATGGLLELGQRAKSNKLHLWNRLVDTLEDHSQKMRGRNLHSDTVLGQGASSDVLYALNSIGEHWLQTILSLSLANTVRFNKEGNPVWKDDFKGNADTWEEMPDLFEVMEVDKNNQLVAKKGYKVNEVIQLFKERQSFINHSLNGIYNEIDRMAIQRHSLGRQATLFRKYIKPGFNRRFRTGAYYHGPQYYREGFHYTTLNLSVFNLWRKILASLRGREYSFMAQYENLSAHQKANLLRSMSEFGFMVAFGILGYVLKNLSDDDDENWALNMLAYQANRSYTELAAWVPGPWTVNEALRLLKSPAAGVNAIDNLMNLVNLVNYVDITDEGIELEVIKSGYNKGEYRLVQNLRNVTPFWRTVDRIMHPSEQLLFYSRSY